MTLAQWLQSWPYVGRHYIDHRLGERTKMPDGRHTYVVADALSGEDSTRTWAFDLDDYAVSSVSGGSIWFRPKRKTNS